MLDAHIFSCYVFIVCAMLNDAYIKTNIHLIRISLMSSPNNCDEAGAQPNNGDEAGAQGSDS